MADPYVYPGTSVLINQLGIKNPETLAIVEGRFFVLRSLEPLPAGQWDYDHLKSIHRHFFSDLYDWAGQERTVDLAKDNSYFARVPFIASTLTQRFNELKAERYLQDLPLSSFCERMSYYFNEINAVHPFREGNGRTQRIFFHQLAEQAGYYLDWKLLSTRKADYLQANVAGFLHADYQPLMRLLTQITTPIHALRQLELLGINISAHILLQLKAYVESQVHLTQLVQEKHRHLLTDTQLVKQLSQQTILLSQEILESKPHIKPPHLAERGGFISIYERLQQSEWLETDTHLLAKQLRNKTGSEARMQARERDRGGRGR